MDNFPLKLIMKITDDNNILKLLNMIEESVCRKMKCSSDFEFLSRAISSRNRDQISVSTLKRLWGYDKQRPQPYYSTLSILSRFLGFRDWDEFLSHEDHKSPTSFSYTAAALFSHELEVGDQLWITWKPNRVCCLFYQGDNRFVVLSATNSKIRTGDSFTCMLFSEGIPLYMDKFVRDGQEPITFVVGYSGGLTTIRVVKPKGQRRGSNSHTL